MRPVGGIVVNQETGSERVWPYVLPFPLASEKRKLLWSILQSRVGLAILGRVRVDGLTYQHNLIENMPYSNKSIIKYLKQMVKAEVLEEGMEGSHEKGRTVWLKWYKPTRLGKWLVLFLKPPREVSLDSTKAIIEELFHLYASSVVEVCQRYNLDIDAFHRDLDKQYIREVAKKHPRMTPDVAVFGSAALDIYGFVDALPASQEAAFVEERGRYPGGMGSNVAVALSKLGASVAFFGRIGSDPAGRTLLENLSGNRVGISNVHVVDGPSLQTLILRDSQRHRWLFTLGAPQSPLSLASLDEIDWKTLDQCKIVYVGEVFVEVASAIADYARARRKIVIYRPGVPYMKFGVEKLHWILERTTIFVLNQAAWRQLQDASKERMETPSDLLEHGPDNVILTKGDEGCEVFAKNKRKQFPVPHQLQATFKTVDTTGAGDGFSAGLVKGLLHSWSLEKAIAFGQVVARIACSSFGASTAFPTEEKALGAMDRLDLS
jgi:sugar/nucleoside kinase (ribokinase family)